MKEIYKKKCPYCPKEISSLNKKQFEYNFKQHIESHERKQEEKTKGEKKYVR